MNPVIVANYPCATGENPLWHPDDRCVYWTDIPNGMVYRYEPDSGKSDVVYRGAPVGGMTLQEDGNLLFFMEKGAVAVWDSKSGTSDLKYLIREISLERDCRFNDVIADPRGRVFCGTVDKTYSEGRLYRLDPDGSIKLILKAAGLSNGMSFTLDRRGFYHVSTAVNTVTHYDYDETSGEINNPREILNLSDSNEYPDGMTVDRNGDLWIALYRGGALIKCKPTGEVVQQIAFPVKHVTCPAFCGENYRDLYVTTAEGHKRPDSGAAAGSLFKLDVDVSGVPEFRSKVRIP